MTMKKENLKETEKYKKVIEELRTQIYVTDKKIMLKANTSKLLDK